ncbi:MAG: ABC transporter permease [Planctomycetaceae bacterium]|nr:MAG: ABC transporter permease [Planctomycetaceae bacterium]
MLSAVTSPGGASQDERNSVSGSEPGVTEVAQRFTPATLARRGVRYHWAISLSIALGVGIATAVITGALVVGDSMRASLRGLTIDRLGRVDQVILPGVFFQADRMPDQVAGRNLYPVILFDQAVVESGTGDSIRRAGSVQVLGIDARFWELDPSFADAAAAEASGIPTGELGEDEILVNRAVADDLGLKVGDLVTVRLPAEQAVPADSPLGRRDSQTEGIPRLEVVAIVENRGIGRFALQPNQVEPMTVWLNRETIAETLERDGAANALLVTAPAAAAGRGNRDPDNAEAEQAWVDELPLGLSDFGLRLTRVRQTFSPGDADSDADAASDADVSESAGDTGGPDSAVVFDYFHVTSDRLLLPQVAVDAIVARLPAGDALPILTYLANAIEVLDDSGDVTASVPYSTITALAPGGVLNMDFSPPEGDGERDPEAGIATGDAGELGSATAGGPVPIVLNDWAAGALGVEPGATLRVAYYEPEVEDGREIERTFDAVLAGVVPITRPSRPYRRTRAAEFDQRPTIYNDPDLTPTVPGVTDQDSISDWDLPFPLEREISNDDDLYWNEYRLTPKAFIPLAAGQRLFSSRFGDTTSLRIDAERVDDPAALERELVAAVVSQRSRLGWGVIPLRRQQLAASQGTTPFDALFLSLSLFVILAALMLIALLFRLGLLQRAREYGVLLATGFPGGAASKLAFREGAWIAGPGILLGVVGGIGYAAAVLAGLRSWWVGAVTVPFLEFHASGRSLVLGALAGAIASLVTIGLTSRRLRMTPARELLAGRIVEGGDGGNGGDGGKSRRRFAKLPWVLLVIAVGISVAGLRTSGPAQAGAFVGGGMMLLAASLIAIHGRLSRRPTVQRGTPVRHYSLVRLAWANVGRNPLRSTLSIGLMACASFLIISISAFQLSPSESGVGGFDLIGRTATPLYRDLNDAVVRSELLGPDAERLASSTIVPLRLQPGQDASCNNLYQASQPQVYGVPPSIAEATRATPFAWAAATDRPVVAAGEGNGGGNGSAGDGAVTGGVSGEDGEAAWSPWDALAVPAAGTAEDPLPVVLDQNTAMWSLQMRGGLGEVRSFSWREGETIHFRVVGLLINSVLQGSLMIGQENFERHFSHVNGFRIFLVRTPEPDAVRGVLENRLGDVGMDVTPSRTILSRLMAVQNTYLRTFQSLGALGLLLGTVGLAIAQLRSALERRGELGVMRAIGFARRRLGAAVMWETVVLLAAGIGSGGLCAVLAVAPYLVAGKTVPPIIGPLMWVLLIASFGLAAGSLAVARVVRMPLVDALRK